MRNDVKIGIAVGVFVVIVGLVWFVFFSEKPSGEPGADDTAGPITGFGMEEPDENTSLLAADGSSEDTPDERAVGPATPADVEPVLDVAPVDPGPVEDRPAPVDVTPRWVGARDDLIPTSRTQTTDPPDDRAVGSLPRASGRTLDPSTTRTGVRRPYTPPPRSEEPSYLATPPAPVDDGGRVGEPAPEPGDDDRATAPAGQASIYVVVAGDDGFWAISAKVYGAGKHWPLIRDANPGVDTTMLRPGQELVIPPPPEPDTQSTTREELPAGVPPGSRTYVVQDGDTYWDIAEAEYGNGQYHYLLEQANGIDPGKLQKGMVLLVPPKPAPAASASAEGTAEAGTSSADEITPGPGEQIYTVVDGDSFWKIARNIYGQGRLWPAIRNANPDIAPREMREGQKLLLPSIEAARRAVGEDASGSTSGTGGPGTEGRPGRPVFD